MWSPTHVQVVVQRAKGLLTKGKHKTNDCFVTIALGKEKYQTSVKEKASENVEWHEECELQIPEQGNTAEIVLTALHRNFIGVDEFLGTVRIPLAAFDIYEMPKNRWYELQGKPGKENTKDRGKLEVRVGFIVRAGSLSDLSKKERHKRSLGQISSKAQNFGGSLLSIASIEKRKGLKKLAKSIGNKVTGKSKSKSKLDDICDEDEFGIRERPRTTGQEHEEADPGVVSDEDDEFTFDDLSHKSSTSSLNSSTPKSARKHGDGLHQTRNESPLARYNDSNQSQSEINKQQKSPNTPPSKPPRFALNTSSSPKSEVKAQTPTKTEDEWGQKLYGLQAGNTLKRWENKRQSPKILIEEQVPIETNNVNTNITENLNNMTSTPLSKSKGDVVLTSTTDSPNVINVKRENNKLQQQVITNNKANNKDKQSKQNNKKDKKSSSERIIIGGEETTRLDSNELITQPSRLPRELAEQFEGKSREDLIELILNLQLDVADKKKRLHDLEDYIDALLLRVIECSPRLLQNPFQPARRLSSPGHQ